MNNRTSALLLGTALLLLLGGEAYATCNLTCPANITTGNTGNQCGANVNYSAPSTIGTCGAVTCTPPSGSFFAVGQTTVSCSAPDTTVPPHDGACTFTVTVNDVQPPTITCPANITQQVPYVPWQVNFNANASDNCAIQQFACVPPSGSQFPAGNTNVQCTATDPAGNTASCVTQVSLTPLPSAAPIPVVAPLGLGVLLVSLAFAGIRLLRTRGRN